MTQTTICLITTGGTIGSSTSSNSVSVSQGEQQLHDFIEQECTEHGWQLDIKPAFNKNSEDLTPDDWFILIEHVQQAVASGYRNIVITHGTDTMAYTAAALGLCCFHPDAKVVLTGSCYPLDHPKSDVAPNILGAFKTATEKQLPNGVYVSFCNPKQEVLVIDALNIKPMIFDELGFDGCYKQRLGIYQSPQDDFEPSSPQHKTHPLSGALDSAKINRQALEEATSKAFQLACYPGMNALQLCSGFKSGSFVVINLYHSGTGPSLAGENSLIEAIKQRDDLTFVLTALPSKYLDKPYASSLTLIKAGALLTKDIQAHQLYSLLVLGTACNMSKQETLSLLGDFLM